VSRDFELQADQLGVQYTWASGYDPSGFIRFFDKMATTKGFVEGAAWFHDHPPFFDRMIEAEREITFLPRKPRAVVQTSEFEEMKRALAELSAKTAEEEKDKPSLKRPALDCPVPTGGCRVWPGDRDHLFARNTGSRWLVAKLHQ